MQRISTSAIHAKVDCTLDGGGDERKDDTAIDVPLQEAEEDTYVTDNGHGERRDDDPI